MKKILKLLGIIIVLLGAFHTITGWTLEETIADLTGEEIREITAYDRLIECIENRESEVTLRSGEWDESLGEWEEALAITQDIVHENPEWYWIDFTNSQYWYLGDEDNPRRAIKLEVAYHEELDNEETQAQIDAAADAILSTIPTDVSDWEKARLIHDALIKHITYEENEYDQNIYGALVLGKCVCTGYTMAYEYLLDRVGIPCDTVTGYTSEFDANLAKEESGVFASSVEGHAWNVVTFTTDSGVEQSYYVDVTWDDTDLKDANGNDYYSYNWFCVSQSEMDAVGHVLDGDFYSLRGWNMSYEDLNYYVYKDALLTEYNADAIVEIFRRQMNEGNNVLSVRWANKDVYLASKIKLEGGDLSYIVGQLGLGQTSYSFNSNILEGGNFCLNIYL